MRTGWRIATGLVIVGVLTTGGIARADTWSTPIAVPRIGTEGPASVYPATLNVVALGGAFQTGKIQVELHRVTHPCPEDLAILLVHNDTDKYLLMSNAGGCRPLQGTSVQFTEGEGMLPDSEPASPPHSAFADIDPSNYGATPVFPAPAPPGPYTLGMPPAATNINGTWSLYVMDTGPGNRGVISGWSLQYDLSPTVATATTNVAIPGGVGTGSGAAATYPITFDFTTLSDAARVSVWGFSGLVLDLHMNHTFPDDLRMVLQSPTGTAVVLMANAGGGTDLPAGKHLHFSDIGGAGLAPDNAPIANVAYKPGGAYGASIALGGAAPQPPYLTTFAALDGEPARGTWRLWIYDDANANVGALEDATLTIALEHRSSFEIVSPSIEPSSSDQPFVRIEATADDGMGRFSYTWRNVANGEFYDAGLYTRIAGTDRFYADVPVRKGANIITTTVLSEWVTTQSFTNTVNVNEFTYSLAEGATGSFFDTELTFANPGAVNAPVKIDVLLEGGGELSTSTVLDADGLLQLSPEESLPNHAFSTVVHSTDGIPLAVERTMIWDGNGYGGHGGTAVAPNTRWLFAEGSQGYFHTYVLLANNGNTAANVQVTFLLEGGGTVQHPVTVDPHARRTIDAAAIPELANRSFGIDVSSDQNVIAERAMYLPGARLFEGGHESAGVNTASRQWFLAEGATGSFFECFILMSNPTAVEAHVTLTYLRDDGVTVTQNVTIPPNARHTINVETVDPLLANAAVSTTIVSDVAIIAERSMYWPGIDQGWQETHNSFGVTQTGLRWGLADVRVGGPRTHQTYVLLANPNLTPAEVAVRFLRPGAAPVTRSYTVAPTSRMNLWVNNDVPELGDGTFSVDVQVLNYQPIAVEKALYWNSEGAVWAGGTNVTATMLPPK
jgi:subtilisin-like proprotein convertase family protein